jgi:hypothetical protein
MPTLLTGLTLEPAVSKLWELFNARNMLQKEIERRAWKYLTEIGYIWYKQHSIDVTLSERNEVQVVRIVAYFEHQWTSNTINLDVPLQQFEAVVPPRPESNP